MRRFVFLWMAYLFFVVPDLAIAEGPSAARLQLTEAQRQQVVQAVNPKDTEDKLPPDFQPSVGATVPSQEKMPMHPLPRPLVYQVAVLKQYYYAKLPKNVVIVDPMTKKVVDVIPR